MKDMKTIIKDTKKYLENLKKGVKNDSSTLSSFVLYLSTDSALIE